MYVVTIYIILLLVPSIIILILYKKSNNTNYYISTYEWFATQFHSNKYFPMKTKEAYELALIFNKFPMSKDCRAAILKFVNTLLPPVKPLLLSANSKAFDKLQNQIPESMV